MLLDPTAPPVTPTISPSCTEDVLCDLVYRYTGLEWLAQGSYYLLVKPVRIVLIVLAAVVLRHLLIRTIRRLTKISRNASRPGLLRPLRERLPEDEPAGQRLERRRQRAEALGSVLRSVTSISLVFIALMLVLSELGVDLAPLLASAGIVGVALGFGAQHLVKDFLAGLFMLLEDQYGVGDVVDVGEASGTVEAVGLRITTIRDARGVIWYIRNGEIVRVGNKSQGSAVVVVDVPVGFAGLDEATAVLREAAATMTSDEELASELLEPPDVLGVEQITVDGAVVRVTAKTSPHAQWRIGRELRRRLSDALDSAGITQRITASRVFVRPPTQNPGPAGAPGQNSPIA